jgi:hypothetical protein
LKRKIFKMKKLLHRASKYFKKASDQEKDLAAQQAAFYKTMTANYNTQFADQGAILSSLKTAFEPILSAGIDQFGFSPQETASLRTSASDNNATQFNNAQKTLNNDLAARGGGNTFLPSGADAQLQASLLGGAATQESNSQNQITEAGYNQGRSNFLAAESVLSGTAKLYDPTLYAGDANQAGASAFQSADTIQAQNDQWQTILGGVLGGVAGAATGGLGSAVSTLGSGNWGW